MRRIRCENYIFSANKKLFVLQRRLDRSNICDILDKKKEHLQELCGKCKELKEKGYNLSCKEFWMRTKHLENPFKALTSLKTNAEDVADKPKKLEQNKTEDEKVMVKKSQALSYKTSISATALSVQKNTFSRIEKELSRKLAHMTILNV